MGEFTSRGPSVFGKWRPGVKGSYQKLVLKYRELQEESSITDSSLVKEFKFLILV